MESIAQAVPRRLQVLQNKELELFLRGAAVMSVKRALS